MTKESVISNIIKLARLAYREHFWVDGDDWYSCPKAPNGCFDEGQGTECNCGAEEHNAEVDMVYNKIMRDLYDETI